MGENLMNKKLLVLAVTSALAATTAQADTANVNVYGKLYPQFEINKVTGRPTEQEVQASNSAIGFKGDVDIGGGMKGWFQVETNLTLDRGVGTWGSRNSAAGISGGFGNVFLGQWDTVYKQLGDPVSFLGVSAGNFVSNASVLSQAGFDADGDTSFHLRLDNYVQYETPEISGFQFLVGYMPDETRSTGGPNTNIISLGAKWESGPLYLALANETHNDTNSLSTALGGTAGADSKDTATRFSISYSLPTGTKVGLDVANMKYEDGGAEYDHNAYNLVASHKVGAWSFAASYTMSEGGDCTGTAGITCPNTSQLDANQISLGARYDFNKRVSWYAITTKISNDAAALHNSTNIDVSAGQDPTAYGVGIIVTF
jgi:predicted porin